MTIEITTAITNALLTVDENREKNPDARISIPVSGTGYLIKPRWRGLSGVEILGPDSLIVGLVRAGWPAGDPVNPWEVYLCGADEDDLVAYAATRIAAVADVLFRAEYLAEVRERFASE